MAGFKASNLQIRRGPNPADPLLHAEPELLPDGTLQIGKADGGAWRYLPAGAPGGAWEQGFVAIGEQLATLRELMASDEELAAQLDPIQEQLDTLVEGVATDEELAQSLAVVSGALLSLATTDQGIAGQIAQAMAAIAALNNTYASDAELAIVDAKIIALTGQVIQSAIAPVNPAIGQRWVELSSSGGEIYDFTWVWRGTEWRSDRPYTIGVGTGRISGSAAARQDLGGLPPWPGLAGYRLIRGTLRANQEGAGSWRTKIRKYTNAATIVDPPWIVGPTVAMAAKGVGLYPLDVPADSLLPQSICALELGLTKGATVADTIFALSTQWAAVRAS
jgi:hypothetical protein